jgi:DNA processing protein
VAVVGTRRPTRFGLEVARATAKSAHRAGFAVVSGLAAGIDTAAHKSALAAGGRTWAVIGSGVDTPTPIANTDLAYEIIDSGGGVISEVPPGTAASRSSLAARDRIQSGLCLAVVVCQCETTSGAMCTAQFAIAQHRLLIVARPSARDAESPASSGNIALLDPAGCAPGLLWAKGETADLVRPRQPPADIGFDTQEELGRLFSRLGISNGVPKHRAEDRSSW